MTYRKLRIKLLISVFVIAVGTVGYLLYKDFTAPTPMPAPVPNIISSDSPIKADPPNDNEKKTYTVPASHPRRLIIGNINVDALIKPVGVLPNSVLDAPKTAWDVGWYDKSGLPGDVGTPLFLDGHVNDALNAPGVFFQLNTLKPGDPVTVERGDGQTIEYNITKVDMLPDDKVDMKALLTPSADRQPKLVIITCGGIYDRSAKTYTDRIILQAERA